MCLSFNKILIQISGSNGHRIYHYSVTKNYHNVCKVANASHTQEMKIIPLNMNIIKYVSDIMKIIY